ncbi:hypothetical protein L2E82_12867 [Cichorium intybus]|uniref:Uncharacterized protein n=1 Tax=Cichorium intybus TaxID=13427 RepID=A0ACB9GIG6_CICIN|nr:hypothetical protein L2E82_12867 [Cichorium intybus]
MASISRYRDPFSTVWEKKSHIEVVLYITEQKDEFRGSRQVFISFLDLHYLLLCFLDQISSKNPILPN